MTLIHKFVPGALVPDRTLGARQVRGIASNGSEDRDGDIVDPSGADLAAYRANPIVLAAHNPSAPIGTADVTHTANGIEATISFAPAGASKASDEFCNLAKAGVVRALSIGFRPTDAEPRGNGRGFLFKSWQLLELSLVAVPSNSDALIIERGFGRKDGRVLAAHHGDALKSAHAAIGAGMRDMATVIEAAGMTGSSVQRAFSGWTKGGLVAQEHLDALMRAHKAFGGARRDVAGVLEAAGRSLPDDDAPEAEEDEDEELSFLAQHGKRTRLLARSRGQGHDADAARRKRLIAVAAARAAPLSAADKDAIARARLIESARRSP